MKIDLEGVVVGENDTLFIKINDENAKDLAKNMFTELMKVRPDLQNRVFVVGGDVEMAVVKGEDEEDRSMKGVC